MTSSEKYLNLAKVAQTKAIVSALIGLSAAFRGDSNSYNECIVLATRELEYMKQCTDEAIRKGYKG